MIRNVFPLAIILERRKVDNPWITEKWEVTAVLPDNTGHPPGSPQLLSRTETAERWLHTGFTLSLHPSEAEGYYLNVTAPEPKIFVCWRMEGEMAQPLLVSASYAMAARMDDAGENMDGIPMPRDLLREILLFVDTYYEPTVKRKRKVGPQEKKHGEG